MAVVYIKISLNDDDPVDAALIAVLWQCLPRRRAAKARELMAAGLGVAARPAQTPVRRKQAAPERLLEQAADTKKTDALDKATNNFLRGFG